MATDADFDTSLAQVLAFEGGYVNDPDDPGGATNQGVTQRTYDAFRLDRGLATQDVKRIAPAEVRAIYYERYWQASGADQLAMPLALIHFDTAVNMGVTAANAILAKVGSDSTAYLAARKDRYEALAAANPTLTKFLGGWLNRVAVLAKHVGPAPIGVALGLLALGLIARALSR